MFDRNLIGKTSGPETFEITPEAVAQFMEATGDPAAHKEPRDPDYVPLTFPTTFRIANPSLGLDGSKLQLIHGEQEYQYARPLRVGERLTCTSRIADIQEKVGRSGAMTFIISEIKGCDNQGELVFTGRSTLIVRTKKAEE
ncbi:MAG TPA: MaoC family dehydratase N-terminal domain-containing protein [Ktedonobacteraceae bacterium]|nr:MaoC family dehydratase N-terminal domain-containing protein [Ktedonobacteraceae bacterium]